MRYLLTFTIVPLIAVSLYTDASFLYGNSVPGRYPDQMFIAATVFATLASMLGVYLMQIGVNKGNQSKFLNGVMAFLITTIVAMPVFWFGWGILPGWHIAVVLTALVWTWVLYRFFDKSLKAARNGFIAFYIVLPSLMIVSGLPAVLVAGMTFGTFVAIPLANYQD